MFCKKAYGGPSLRTSLCTCERQHSSTREDLYTACVGRVVDRTYRVAKGIGEEELAERVYQKAYACRPTKQGNRSSTAARKCLLRVLEKTVYGTRLDGEKAFARKLVTKLEGGRVGEAFRKGENLLTSVRVVDTTDYSLRTLSWRVLAVCVYIVGLLIILLGVSDIAAYWRRHQVRCRKEVHFVDTPVLYVDHGRRLRSQFEQFHNCLS